MIQAKTIDFANLALAQHIEPNSPRAKEASGSTAVDILERPSSFVGICVVEQTRSIWLARDALGAIVA